MGERYVIKDRWIFDTKLNKNIHSIDCYEEKNVLDIMNGQDKEIKEKEKEANTYAKEIVFLDNKIKLLERENQQLKQSQKQLANSKLEMLHDMFCSTINNRILQNYVCSIIRGEIEELKIDGKL